MKKIIVLLAFVLTSVTFAQEKITEGVLTQSQTMSSANEEMNAQLAMMGEMVTTTYFKGGSSYSKMTSPMMGESISIINGAKKEMLMLLDNPMTGKKYVKKSTEDSKEAKEDVIVEKTNETKKFLGYDCVKYNVVMKKDGQEVKMTMYTTDKLNIANKKVVGLSDKINGFPLYSEFSVNQMGAEIIIKIEVKSIKAEKVDDAKFDLTIPEGYEKADNLPGM